MRFSFFSPVRGGPGEIRGRQMADRLGGRFNPEDGYEDDVCVYVAGTGPGNGEPRLAFYDVLDTHRSRLARVKRKTKGDLIAVSLTHRQALREYMPGREVHLIPQHHCNFDRERRPERPVRRVGCIGGDSAVQWPHYAMERMFAEIGMEWVFCRDYSRRRKVVEFYRGLDVQVSWRPTHARGLELHMNPLKLSNAGSFGIPTVAYPEPAYIMEWGGSCVWASTIHDLIERVGKLRDDRCLYEAMSVEASRKAEEYHIDRIAKLYRGLV